MIEETVWMSNDTLKSYRRPFLFDKCTMVVASELRAEYSRLSLKYLAPGDH